MPLNPTQQATLDKVAQHLGNQLLRNGGSWFYAQWQASGLRDADLLALVQALTADRKAAILPDLRAQRKAAEDAGLTAQEWAAIQAAP